MQGLLIYLEVLKHTNMVVKQYHDQNQLKEVYNKIVNQILNEYLISYKATMEPADKKYVKVDYKPKSGMLETVRFYFLLQ